MCACRKPCPRYFLLVTHWSGYGTLGLVIWHIGTCLCSCHVGGLFASYIALRCVPFCSRVGVPSDPIGCQHLEASTAHLAQCLDLPQQSGPIVRRGHGHLCDGRARVQLCDPKVSGWRASTVSIYGILTAMKWELKGDSDECTTDKSWRLFLLSCCRLSSSPLVAWNISLCPQT